MEEVLSVVLSKEKETEKSHGNSLLASWLPGVPERSQGHRDEAPRRSQGCERGTESGAGIQDPGAREPCPWRGDP